MNSQQDTLFKLSELIENITTSGEKDLDEAKMKNLKKICRISDDHIREAYKLLIAQLNQKHSEIRIAAFSICCELFSRSNTFRELLIAEFQEFTKLILDIDPEKPLPPPVAAAKHLKLNAIKSIKQWNDTYGEAYKKLRIGYNYLKNTKIIDFGDLEVRSLQERQRNEEKEAKLRLMKTTKLKQILEEVSNYEEEINNCVSQLENGISILVPNDFLSGFSTEPDDTDTDNDLRAHGMTNPNFNLTVEVKKIQIRVTKDNQDLIRCLQDQHRLLSSRLMPLVRKWNISAAKLGAEEELQKRILDLKFKLETVSFKFSELQLPSIQVDDCVESSDCDSDLETVVDEEGCKEDIDNFPSELVPCVYNIPQPGSSNPKQKKKQLLPTNIETYQANSNNFSTPTFSLNPVESFWVSSSQDPDNDPARTAAIFTVPVGLSEDFNPVKWTCRAPLPSGKLCPRSDRRKCPLHGPVIARDELGNPQDPTAITKSKSTVPDWQEPALLAEIKAATGVDLTMPVKGKRTKKREYPNLTDLKALKNTSRSRLEKKVFKSSKGKRLTSPAVTNALKFDSGTSGYEGN